MKQILLLTLSLLSMSLWSQNGSKTTTDYYRFIPIDEDPALIVKGNDADSIVVYGLHASKNRAEDSIKADSTKITSYVINRGDTLLYMLTKEDGMSQLYLSNDGRHLSQAIVSDSVGNARTVGRDSCIAANQWVQKLLNDGYVHDSIVCTYYKDSLVQRKFYPNDYEPRSIKTMKFDKDSRLIEVLEDNEYTDISFRLHYDSKGILQSMDGTFKSRGEEPEHKTATVKTELNDRGDWVKMVIFEDGKFSGGKQREIFYKK